jgi:hypothetical protein
VVNSESIYSKSCEFLLLFSSKYHKLSTLLQTRRSIATKPISLVAITLPMAWNGNAAVGRQEPMSCESALLKRPFLLKSGTLSSHFLYLPLLEDWLLSTFDLPTSSYKCQSIPFCCFSGADSAQFGLRTTPRRTAVSLIESGD